MVAISGDDVSCDFSHRSVDLEQIAEEDDEEPSVVVDLTVVVVTVLLGGDISAVHTTLA